MADGFFRRDTLVVLLRAGIKCWTWCRREVVGGAGVARGEDLRTRVLVDELLAVDGPAAGTVAPGKVAALADRVGGHAVEGADLILHHARNHMLMLLHHRASSRYATVCDLVRWNRAAMDWSLSGWWLILVNCGGDWGYLARLARGFREERTELGRIGGGGGWDGGWAVCRSWEEAGWWCVRGGGKRAREGGWFVVVEGKRGAVVSAGRWCARGGGSRVGERGWGVVEEGWVGGGGGTGERVGRHGCEREVDSGQGGWDFAVNPVGEKEEDTCESDRKRIRRRNRRCDQKSNRIEEEDGGKGGSRSESIDRSDTNCHDPDGSDRRGSGRTEFKRNR